MSILPLLFPGCMALIFGIVAYIFTAWGLYAIAHRRGLEKPWLAWVPVGQNWLLGSISDHYQLHTNYATKYKRTALLWLSIGALVLLVVSALFFIVAVKGFLEADYGHWFVAEWRPALQDLGKGAFLYALCLLVSVICTVVQYVALYDLYRSCTPENAMVYLLLSILLGCCMPFLIFACREKEDGMTPPRSSWK